MKTIDYEIKSIESDFNTVKLYIREFLLQCAMPFDLDIRCMMDGGTLKDYQDSVDNFISSLERQMLARGSKVAIYKNDVKMAELRNYGKDCKNIIWQVFV